MDITLLVALGGKSVQECETADSLGFFEVLCLSGVAREILLGRRVCCCWWVEFLCDVRVWGSPLRCNSFYGRSVVPGYNAVENIEQQLERPWRPLYQYTRGRVLEWKSVKTDTKRALLRIAARCEFLSYLRQGLFF